MTAKKSLFSMFGIGDAKDGRVFPVHQPGRNTPREIPWYRFKAEILRPILLWDQGIGSKNLYLPGPTAAGKTSLVEQVLARTGKQVFKVGCHKRIEMADFLGRLTIKKDGSTEFVYGALPLAMKLGGVLLMDESDQLSPTTAMGLVPILDGGSIYIPETGEWIDPHPDFRVAATGNTAGRGDESGLYRGAERQNVAWLTRFIFVKVDYLSVDEEVELLHHIAPELPEDISRAMAKTASEVRKVFVGASLDGELETVISTRDLLQWAQLTVAYSGVSDCDPIMEGLNLAVLNSSPQHEVDAIRGIWQRITGEE